MAIDRSYISGIIETDQKTLTKARDYIMRITTKILQKQLDELNNSLGSSFVFIRGYDENFQKNIYGLDVHQGSGKYGRTADEMYAYLEGALDYSYLGGVK
jgi:hypothetical protein